MADAKISALTAAAELAEDDLLPVVDISDTTDAASGTTKKTTQGQLGVFRNPVINGNFDIWQRATSFAAVANNTTTADRWQWFTSGTGVVTISQSTDVPTLAQSGVRSLFSLKVDCTTLDSSIASTDRYVLCQPIEGYEWLVVDQRIFTVGFWVKSTKTGTFCLCVQNGATDRSYIATYTVNATNTWEYKTATFTASPTSGTWNYTTGIGVYLVWTIAAGSNFQSTAGSWNSNGAFCTSGQVNGMDSTSNDFLISQVTITPGSAARRHPYEPYADVLHRCQRYFYTAESEYIGIALNATRPTAAIKFAVTMRTAPTLFSGSFTPNAGSAGTPSLYNTSATGAAPHNNDNNWTTNALINFTGKFTAEL